MRGLILFGVLACIAADRPRLHPLPRQSQNAKTGPEVGTPIPWFQAIDQNGRRQTFDSLHGPKGLVLQFDRSADWCPSCKGALLDLNSRAESFRSRGFGVAALTYDSIPVLRSFSDRNGIAYTLLSDPNSAIIRAFGLLNENIGPGSPAYGIAFPGMFIVDEKGIVRAKYFEDDNTERYSAANIVTHQFDVAGVEQTVNETPHLKLVSSTTDNDFAAGRRIGLVLELDIKPGMHVYAPGVEGGYIPIQWKVAGSKSWIAFPVTFPAATSLRLRAIRETVPVYQGRVRLLRDLTIGQEEEIAEVMDLSRSVAVEGSFSYQACDERQCYVPKTIPLRWIFHIERRDMERVPPALQRK